MMSANLTREPGHTGSGVATDQQTTDRLRELVSMYSIAGMPAADIAGVLNMPLEEMEKEYSRELEYSLKQANALITNTLYHKALNGDVKACQAWLKAKAGWLDSEDGYKKKGGQETPSPYGLGLLGPIAGGQRVLPLT